MHELPRRRSRTDPRRDGPSRRRRLRHRGLGRDVDRRRHRGHLLHRHRRRRGRRRDWASPARRWGRCAATSRRAAAAVVGVDEVRFLGYPDGRVEATLDLRRDLARVIRAGAAAARGRQSNPIGTSTASTPPSRPPRRPGWRRSTPSIPTRATGGRTPSSIDEGLEPRTVDEVWLDAGGADADALHRHHRRGRSQDRSAAVAQEPDARPGGDGDDGAKLARGERGSRRAARRPLRRDRARRRHTLTTGGRTWVTTHPLDMLTGDEIERAVEIVRDVGPRARRARCSRTSCCTNPHKAELAQWKRGDPVDRAGARRSSCPGPTLQLHRDRRVGDAAARCVEWREVEGMRPALLMTEAMNAIFTTKEHPEYVAALARRGITDLDAVQIDPWPAGVFGYDAEDGPAHRALHLVPPRTTRPTTATRARSKGSSSTSTWARNEVIEVIDHGVVAAAAEPGELLRRGPAEPARPTSKPISITQPEGPSFTVDGNLVAVAEVAVPRRVRSVRGAGAAPDRVRRRRASCVRSCTARRSARWSSRTAIRATVHGWKNAFDAGEWGLGRMTQPLTLGCDCVGEIHYFDATLANEQGAAVGDRERDLHARGGLRDPLEARRPVGRAQRGAPQPPPRRQLRRRPSATTSTASSGTSTSTATSSSR